MGKFVYSVGMNISVATTIDSLHAYAVHFLSLSVRYNFKVCICYVTILKWQTQDWTRKKTK